MEAQILQWQSAYVSKDDNKTSAAGFPRREGVTGANTAPLGSASRLDTASPSIGPSSHSNPDATAKTVHRSGGGTTWTDSTLLEWDPAHFRLFVGNLAGEVTDESLLKAFSKYPSVQKARVVRDKRTTKSKGYGFVSFSDGDEYFAAGRDMQGKYIGSHPVLLKRSNTEVKAAPANNGNNKHGKHGKGRNGGAAGAGGHGKVEHGGIYKKQPKTKGGLRVLG
jgi:RNA recognition motif. (a.k.a. RRM, RBD, or RNP domain)